MTTLLKLGPADRDRELTVEEFFAGDYQEGYRYELIDGRLYVSPQPDSPADFLERWIHSHLFLYALQRPDVINYVSPKARVFVPGRPGATVPEPDTAAYHEYPLDLPVRQMRWQNVSPILVVEILDEDNPDKDLNRNVRLYRQVPSILEYWVVDPRPDPEQPTLIVHRRSGNRWRTLRIPPGDTYTTRLLPGFELIIDPRR